MTEAERNEERLEGLLAEAVGSNNILQKADRATTTDRNKYYGHPLDNHSVTAGLWGVYLGVDIGPEDVCFLNILQKVSRTVSGEIIEDTLIDIAGYARNVEMIQLERDERASEAGE